jgi:ribosomal protein S27E
VATVRCPDCGAVLEVPAGAREGTVLECPTCAGHGLRLGRRGGEWVATLAHRVSCPVCGRSLTLPEGVRAGDPIECCGRRYRLSFEFGAFAADEA